MNTVFKVLFLVTLLPVLSLTISPADDYTAAWRQSPEPLACMMQGQMTILTLSPSRKQSAATAREWIRLNTPTRSVETVKRYQDGDKIFFSSSVKGISAVEFGTQGYRKMIFQGKPSELNSFQQKNEPWACVIDGLLYREVAGRAEPLAKVAWRTYQMKGEQRRVVMCQRLDPGEKWCFHTPDGQVFTQDESNRIALIGHASWRLVTLSSGVQTLMFMTRGADQKAKWISHHEGKWVVENKKSLN